MKIISLDDDLSIHQIWKGRILANRLCDIGVSLQTFTSGAEFKRWVRDNSTSEVKFNCLYLIDFELLNQNETGLDLIEELGIGEQAILVSSRYEEIKIRERCEKLGTRLLPKAMAGFVPIEVAQQITAILNPDAVVIDDEPLQKSIWNMVAKEKQKYIEFFEEPSGFLERTNEFDKGVPVFVDSNLGSGIMGEDIALKLHKLGFTNLYLATGYQQEKFSHLTYLKGVVGKEPFL